ncbi:MAG: hypothetical protein U0940_00615, partial [Nitrospirota bacterium]|nr:hypothetical protein [Nitrospirota bacterium]
MSMSLDDIKQAVRAALIARFPAGNGDCLYWIRELFLDHAIIEDNAGALYRIDYSMKEDGSAELGENPSPVEITYTPIQESIRLIESKDP